MDFMRNDGVSFVLSRKVALLGNFVHVRISGFIILGQPEVVVLRFHIHYLPSFAVMPPSGGYGVGKAASLSVTFPVYVNWSSPDCFLQGKHRSK